MVINLHIIVFSGNKIAAIPIPVGFGSAENIAWK
jgi:hypothetical protein